MNLPLPIFGDKKIICTNDGSFTFYSMEYGESYKTKSLGAYTESLHKFVNGSEIIDMLGYKDVRLLDICFGIGMNLAATIDKMIKSKVSGRLHAVSVELDHSLPLLVSKVPILFPTVGYAALREAVKNGSSGRFSLELHIADAKKIISRVTGKFDVIYFDPFSKKHNPEMWTEDVFVRMLELLADGGCLVTYASSKGIKSLMERVGFELAERYSIGSRYQPSVVAKKRL